jgi:hypothetical protein
MLVQKEGEMKIRKFIEEIGEKVIPARRSNNFAQESSESIRRHILSRRDYVPPSDLVVIFDETDDKAIVGGTVRDDATRERIIEDVGNIQGVEKVDDRMVSKA